MNRVSLTTGPHASGRVLTTCAVAALALSLAGTALAQKGDKPAEKAATPAVRVEWAKVARTDVPRFLTGLGNVQAFYSVAVTPRVDGQLVRLEFTEGQTVKRGDVIAQIDPRPYKAVYDQAVATLHKDTALLANARLDLQRYQKLAPDELASKQTVETQRTSVAQLEAQVAADQAVVDNAATQLDYTTLRSPIDGRTGIRLTDLGNVVRAAGNTPVVNISQIQPISLVFTVPAENRLAIEGMRAKGKLAVTALSRDGQTQLATGELALVDNQVDLATGTLKLKAVFANKDHRLWPGDFVSARLALGIEKGALTAPSAGIQRGPTGPFAYVVKEDSTVEVRPVKIAGEAAGLTVIADGLQEGERVTTSNQYRLRAGASVQLVDAAAGGAKR